MNYITIWAWICVDGREEQWRGLINSPMRVCLA